MREYETTFIVQPEISESGRDELLEKFDGVLGKQDSKRLFIEDMGKRRLAYEIQDFQKGHYLTLHFLNDGAVVNELERTMQLDRSILRYLTVLVNERVEDVAAREAEGVELEKERLQRAEERATQRAEEEAAAAERAVQQAAEEAARQVAAAEAAAAAAASEEATPEEAASEEATTEEATAEASADTAETAAPEASADTAETAAPEASADTAETEASAGADEEEAK